MSPADDKEASVQNATMRETCLGRRGPCSFRGRGLQGGAVLVLLLAVLVSNVRAQGRSLAFDLQPFRLAATSCGLLSLEGTRIGAHLYPRALLQLAYQRDPLLYEGLGQTTRAVGDRIGGELVASMGLFDRVEVGLDLPVVLYQHGDEIEASASVGGAPSLRGAGIGDLRIVVKGRIFGGGPRGFSLAAVASLRLPTAQEGTLAGAGLAFSPELLGGFRWGRVVATMMLGYRLQPRRDLYSLRVDDELLYGIGGEVRVWRRLVALVEVMGATAAADPFGEAQTSPLVARVGARMGFGDFEVTLAGGPGIVSGYGAPKVQLLASLGWVPGGLDSDGDRIPDRKDDCPFVAEDRDGFQDADGCPDSDNDRDGIADSSDHCPNKAEDKDGFSDLDGCPDPDNDKDGILDGLDLCPNAAEDKDGFQDLDGCPDLDNDKDGIPDKRDKCPNKPEIMNGVDDEDGCPEADRDADGIFDDVDACPDEPEDKNGIEDNDGCPEDPDGDRIPNRRDRCPREKETFNGYQDEDGCPDDPTPKVVIKRSVIVTSESIYFDTDKWDVKPRSRRLLMKLAAAIKRDKKIRVVYVEGHADMRGTEKYNQWLSYKRAKAVVRYLRRLGVSRYRLRALGWGQQRPWDTADTPRGLARNRRVRFHVERTRRALRVRIAPPKRKVPMPSKRVKKIQAPKKGSRKAPAKQQPSSRGRRVR